MTNSINRRQAMTGVAVITVGATIATTPAIAKQNRDNDKKITKAVAEWLEVENVYYETSGDISDKLSSQIADQQHPLEVLLATTPADTWAGVRCKIDWLQHDSNIHFVNSGRCRDVLTSAFADVVRLSV